MVRPRLTRFSLRPLAATACMFAAATGAAQSAADKATARNLATEGIRLFQEGKHTEALDRLQRAQTLYDAPVHLVYMARAQAQLGRLVEAAETYRRLVRTELGPNAPGPFRKAVSDGRRELADLDPRIPGLTITLDSDAPPGLELRIDNEVVSAAILGVRRPIDPGQHSVAVTAPGYAGDERIVEIKESEHSTVQLSLKPQAPATAEATTSLPSGPAPPAQEPQVEGKPADETAESSSAKRGPTSLGIILGLRPAVIVPAGTLYRDPVAGDVRVADRFGAGAGLEGRAGLLFARYFTTFLYVEGYGVNAGPGYDDADTQVTPTVRAAGLGATAGTAPGSVFDKTRVYGELAISGVEAFGADIEATSGTGGDAPTCTASQTYSGAALRLGGGADYLWTDWFRIGPYLAVSMGQTTSLEGTIDCEGDDPGNRFGALTPLTGTSEVAAEDRRPHSSFFLGVTGEFIIRLK